MWEVYIRWRSNKLALNFRSFYDRNLNSEQQQAVQKIVSGSSRPAPYLVFGPPGTGKTVTLVEAIKQVSCITRYSYQKIWGSSQHSEGLRTTQWKGQCEHRIGQDWFEIYFRELMSLLDDQIREQARWNKSSVLIRYSSGQDGPFFSLLHYVLVHVLHLCIGST